MNKEKMIAAATSYLRAAASAAIALYMSGITDPKTLSYAFVAAFIGPILKAADPSAKDLGRIKQ